MRKFFSQNLNLLRTSWGLSQKFMAEKFGVSQSSYGRWEVNSEPNLDTIIGLADFFKVSVGDLIAKKMEPSDIPPRWGGRAYPEQQDEPAMAVEEPGNDPVLEVIQKIQDEMVQLRQEMAELRERQAQPPTG